MMAMKENMSENDVPTSERFTAALSRHPDLNQLWSSINAFFSEGQTMGDYLGMNSVSEEKAYAVAKAKYEAGLYDEALSIFRHICYTNHLNERYFFGMASCCMMMKNYKQAIISFTYAYCLMPDEPMSMFFAALCHYHQKAYDEAELCLLECEEVVRADPDSHTDLLLKINAFKRNLNQKKSSS